MFAVVNPIPTVILASDTGIYTAVTNDGQLVRLSDEDNRDQDSIGECICCSDY